MKIDLPSGVTFEVDGESDSWGEALSACFTHAVKRVLAGQKVHARLVTDRVLPYCRDCHREASGDQL